MVGQDFPHQNLSSATVYKECIVNYRIYNNIKKNKNPTY